MEILSFENKRTGIPRISCGDNTRRIRAFVPHTAQTANTKPNARTFETSLKAFTNLEYLQIK